MHKTPFSIWRHGYCVSINLIISITILNLVLLMKAFAICLIFIGISLLLFQAFNQKKIPSNSTASTGVADTGDVPWYMYGGALSMAAGVFILMGRKKEEV